MKTKMLAKPDQPLGSSLSIKHTCLTIDFHIQMYINGLVGLQLQKLSLDMSKAIQRTQIWQLLPGKILT
jgi:hypothetical protein